MERERRQRRAQLVGGDGEELVAGVDGAIALGDGRAEDQRGCRRDAHERLQAEERVGKDGLCERAEAHHGARGGDGGDEEDRDGRAVLAKAQRCPRQQREEQVRVAIQRDRARKQVAED